MCGEKNLKKIGKKDELISRLLLLEKNPAGVQLMVRKAKLGAPPAHNREYYEPLLKRITEIAIKPYLPLVGMFALLDEKKDNKLVSTIYTNENFFFKCQDTT